MQRTGGSGILQLASRSAPAADRPYVITSDGPNNAAPENHPSSCSFSFASTLKSSSVVTSPLTSPPDASSLSSRRMILPLRVLGRESVKRIWSGAANALHDSHPHVPPP